MSWQNNVCIKRAHNCRLGFTCPQGTECCYEISDGGEKGGIGHCVAKGTCNHKTGHPTKGIGKCPSLKEGYSKGCFKTYILTILLFFFFCLVGFVLFRILR